MNVKHLLNRKSLVTTLGAAGLGLSLAMGAAGGAPAAMAQDEDTTDVLIELLQDADGGALLEDEALRQALIERLQEAEGGAAEDGLARFAEGRLERRDELISALADEMGVSEDELKQMLIERVQGGEGLAAFLGDEDGKRVLIRRGEDGEGILALRGDGEIRDVVFQRLQEAKAEGEIAVREHLGEKHEEAYAEFKQALADELGISDADEVDAAIRGAMTSVIDSHVDDGDLSEEKAEALKELIASSDAPFAPLAFMARAHAFFVGGHGPGFGPGGEHMLPGEGELREWVIEQRSGERADEGEERSSRPADESNSDDSQSDEGSQG